MSWHKLIVAPCGTHHLAGDRAAYKERFDEVLKFHAPGLAPVRQDGSAWHIHPDGTAAYARRFRRTFGFYEGAAAVIGDDGWHHIDHTGADVYAQRYAWCGNFQGGRCSVRSRDGTYCHISNNGELIYSQRWRYAGDYRDGIAVVQGEVGRSTHIDLQGSLLHEQWFLDLDVFHKGFARARDENGWMHVDTEGKPVYARRFAAVEPFYNGQARVERFDGGLEVIDESGHTVLELRPAQRSEFAVLSGDLVGFWRTQTIASAVELGVFEALPGSTAEVAQRCGLIPDRARRLLKAVAELGLATEQESIWNSTSRGDYLRAGHPLTLADAAHEYAHHFFDMWRALPAALQEGREWKAPDIFEEVAEDDKRRLPHHRMLRSYARHDYPPVPDALALSGNECVIDAGGGLGTMANLLLDAYPRLQVTVLDLPEVIAQAKQEQAARPGLTWCGSDLFQPWPIRGDAVVLARVLHDWDDPAAIQILRRARAAMGPGGRLYVVEMLLAEDGVGGSLCDLHLLVATGGRERTLGDYRSLLAEAGFALEEVRRLPALPSVLTGVAQ